MDAQEPRIRFLIAAQTHLQTSLPRVDSAQFATLPEALLLLGPPMVAEITPSHWNRAQLRCLELHLAPLAFLCSLSLSSSNFGRLKRRSRPVAGVGVAGTPVGVASIHRRPRLLLLSSFLTRR